LNTLINTTEDNTVILNKETLQSMLTCLQVTEAKVRLLQDQSQLLNDELIDLKNQQPVKCSELVFVQNNPLYMMMMMMMMFLINNSEGETQ
jgi:hypothetical protein